jgi:Flp pilus assembly protein TadD
MPQETPVALGYPPRLLRSYVLGRITLGELEGISKEEQVKIAEIAYSYLEENQLEAAANLFRGLALLDPYDAYFQLALGWIAQRRGQLDEAELLYSRSLEINPYSLAALTGRGEVRLLKGRLVEASQDLTRAIQEDPTGKDPAAQQALALVALVRRQLERRHG